MSCSRAFVLGRYGFLECAVRRTRQNQALKSGNAPFLLELPWMASSDACAATKQAGHKPIGTDCTHIKSAHTRMTRTACNVSIHCRTASSVGSSPCCVAYKSMSSSRTCPSSEAVAVPPLSTHQASSSSCSPTGAAATVAVAAGADATITELAAAPGLPCFVPCDRPAAVTRAGDFFASALTGQVCRLPASTAPLLPSAGRSAPSAAPSL
jgi:hypothetical protein